MTSKTGSRLALGLGVVLTAGGLGLLLLDHSQPQNWVILLVGMGWIALGLTALRKSVR